MPPKKVQLGTRERSLFARLIQEYEMKKYKLAVKTADAILAKAPEHGETVAIKGLVLFSMHEREEGLRLTKLGVRYDLNSFICWHALGIVHRMDRNYHESLKCYAQALRIEGGNLNLIRESGFMQLQMRNYLPFIDARLVLLRTQPHLRSNWVALALAHDLAGNKTQAVRVLAGYEDVCRDIPKHCYEYSEVVLYHASLLEEMGDANGVLDLLETQKAHIVDEPSSNAMRARALSTIGRMDDAALAWFAMLERNSENKAWIQAYLDVVATKESRLTHLLDLKSKFPKSTMIRRMILHVAQNADFKEHAREYIEHALVKNVPSLFLDLKSLYSQPDKKDMIEEIVEECRIRWDPQTGDEGDGPPSSYLYAMYYLAHHYSYTGQTSRALLYIDSIIEHTPSMPELHMTRARVLKRAGAYEAAADAMEDARLLDGQDRYLNTKAAKYLLRINKVEEAAKKLKLFTRPDLEDPVVDLVQMQAVDHIVEHAEAHVRRGEYAMALKRIHDIHKTMQDIYDDQLDFHSYCMRKMTLRTYVRTLRFEDHVFAHPAYIHAANEAASLYAKLHDQPYDPEPEVAKYQALKPVQQSQESDDVSALPPDSDPFGLKLAKTQKPLEDAHLFIRKLQANAPNDIRTWISAFEVAIRGQNWLLALRALSLAYRLDPSHPRLAVQFVTFHKATFGKLPDNVREAVDKIVADVPPLGMSPKQYSTEYTQRYGLKSAMHALGAAEVLYAAEGMDQASEVAHLVFGLIRIPDAPLFVLEAAVQFLQRVEKDAPGLVTSEVSSQAFIRAAHETWPHADAFSTFEEKQRQAAARYEARRAWIHVEV